MIKHLTKHTIYEVWNEYAAESVYCDHKPTKEEIKEICLEQWDIGNMFKSKDILQSYIDQYILVERLKPIYTKV